MRIRQLDAVASRFLAGLAQRAPLLSAATDTGPAPRFVFVDDAIIEVHGYQKQGSGHGYSGGPGLNALLTTASTTYTAPVIPGQRQSEGQCLGPPAVWACRSQLRLAGPYVLAYNLIRTARILAAGPFTQARTSTARTRMVNTATRIASSTRRIQTRLPEVKPR